MKKIEYLEYYKNSLLQTKYFRKNGKLYVKCNYKNTNINNNHLCYYPSIKIVTKRFYKDGKELI